MVSNRFNRRGRIQPTPPVCADTVERKHGKKRKVNYCTSPQTIKNLVGTCNVIIPSGPAAGSYQINLATIPSQHVPGAWQSSGAQGDVTLTVNTTIDCSLGLIKSGGELIHQPTGTTIAWVATLPNTAVVLGIVPTGLFTVVVGPAGSILQCAWVGTV